MKRAHGLDRVTTSDDGRFYLSSRFEKGWTARIEKELRRAAFPGTCINWDGDLFEVTAVDPLPVGYRYTLRPWPETEAIRVQEAYDEQSERRRLDARRELKGLERTRRISLALALLAGHLPTSVQERLQSEAGVPATRLTIISAFPLVLLGIPSLLFLSAAGFGAPPEFPIPALLLGTYLGLESTLRISVATSHGKPCGSVAGAIAYGMWWALRWVSGRRG